MRNWASEVRVGIIAGVSASALILLAPQVVSYLPWPHGASQRASESWTPPLIDPVQAASAALARGDSTFIAVAINNTMEFPGVSPAMNARSSEQPYKVYSPASTGLRAARWDEFVPRVVPYAAAYNAVVQVARAKSRS